MGKVSTRQPQGWIRISDAHGAVRIDMVEFQRLDLIINSHLRDETPERSIGPVQTALLIVVVNMV